MAIDHCCPVAWAEDHDRLFGSPVGRSWCLAYRREALLAAPDGDIRVPELLLWQEGPLSIYYAPWDWVNVDAQVMLVGITAGHHQAVEAAREAQRCLRGGLPNEEVLRRADAVGSFSGPMRNILVEMLDGIGLHAALGIGSNHQLFGTHQHLAAHVSAIDYPVFRRDRNLEDQNYTGSGPSLVRHPVLRSLVRACLGARVAMAPEALVIPLGKAAQGAVELLIGDGLLDQRRCLCGLPHPSGANGHRPGQFKARREELKRKVAEWAQARPAVASADQAAVQEREVRRAGDMRQ